MKTLSKITGIENKIVNLFIAALLTTIFSLCVTIIVVALANPSNITFGSF